MSSVAPSPEVEKIQDAVATVKEGQVVYGFALRSLKKAIDRFVDAVVAFDPTDATEETLETTDQAIANIIGVLEAMPGHWEAIGKLTEARDWIAQGYSPSAPPSREQIEKLAQERAAVAMWGESEAT
jgi:hypothetical protein